MTEDRRMTASMVERVAQAMSGSFAGGHPEDIAYWRAAALKAIGAMREPTEVMVDSGENSNGENSDAGDIYRAMIDAALKESP